MTIPQTHPTPAELSAYSLGRLPPRQAEVVENHVTACSPCAETLMELSTEDTFLGLLREADGEPNNDTIDLDVVQAGAVDCQSTTLPAALRNHPRFEVERLIGYGGMGEVYKAQHRLMKRTVALKVIHRKFVRSAEAVERFCREVRAAAHLIHPNIVTAYDAEQVDDTHLLAMEFVEGAPLSEIVHRQGSLPAAVACDYTEQVARGLQHAYEMGMVHRDVKPQNLMVTADGVVKILDFGLASFTHEALEADTAEGDLRDDRPATSSRLTTRGTVMGTPDYIAPEQAGDAHAADIRSDIYSLGCTLYYMLAGKPPFPGDSVMEKLDAHMHRAAPPLADVVQNAPEELSDIVARMTAKDPDERFQTPQQVIDAIVPLIDDPPTAAAATPPRRRPPLVASLLGFAGFAAIAAAMAAWSIQTPLGTVQVRADEAIADDVQVVLSHRGKEVSVLEPGSFSIELKEGSYGVSLKTENVRAQLQQNRVSIERGEKTLIEVAVKEVRSPIERTGTPLLATLQAHDAEVSDLGYAKEKGWLISSSYDGTIKLWDCETGTLVDTLRGHKGKVRSVSVSPNEKILASSGEDGTIRLWNLGKGEEGRVLKEGLPGWSVVRFSPDGRTLASDGKDNMSVTVWDIETGKDVHNFTLGDREPETFEFSPDGKFLAISSHRWVGDSGRTAGGHLGFWNSATGRRAWSIVADRRVIPSLEFSPNGLLLVTGNANHRVTVRTAATGLQMWEGSGHPSWVWDTEFSPDGRLIASACQRISLWDASTQQVVARLGGHYSDQVSLVFLDSKTLASAGYDRTIKLWDVAAAIAEGTKAPQAEEDEDERSKAGSAGLKGNWRLVSFREAGREADSYENPPRVEITSDSIIFRADDEDLEFTRLEYEVDANTRPKQIDAEGEFVRGRPTARLGIYDLDAGALRIVLAPPGAERPASFESSDSDIFRFERATEAPVDATGEIFAPD